MRKLLFVYIRLGMWLVVGELHDVYYISIVARYLEHKQTKSAVVTPCGRQRKQIAVLCIFSNRGGGTLQDAV